MVKASWTEVRRYLDTKVLSYKMEAMAVTVAFLARGEDPEAAIREMELAYAVITSRVLQAMGWTLEEALEQREGVSMEFFVGNPEGTG